MSDRTRLKPQGSKRTHGAGYTTGYWVMGLFYIAAGINHFLHPQMYGKIMPPYLPWPLALVYMSGVAEILGGIGVLVPNGLVFPRTRAAACWGIIAMLVVFLQVHVYMCAYPERFPGIPLWALWIRLPLQVVLIAWAWWYTR